MRGERGQKASVNPSMVRPPFSIFIATSTLIPVPTDTTQKVLPSLSRQFDMPECRYNTRRRRVFASSLGFLGFDTRRGLSPLPCSSLPFHPPPTQHKTRNMKLAWEGHHPSLCFQHTSCHM